MFTSYFYIFILILQLFFAESNFDYNKDVQLVNSLILNQKNKLAFRLVRTMEKKGIFTNNDLVRIDRYLSLKIGTSTLDTSYVPKLAGDYSIKSLAYFQNQQYSKAVEISKLGVQDNFGSDSLIKLYEIIEAKAPKFKHDITQNRQASLSKNIRLNEAMNLLNLMKRKEKTLF